MKAFIERAVARHDLSAEEAEAAVETIMSGEATPAQIAGLLIAWRMKGETVDEILGAARAMRRLATPVRPRAQLLVDTCGTGGDGASTFNISTAAAFVVAGAGLPVAKHGNRSVSSQCGSADVLEALGVSLELTADQVARAIDEVGIGFLFAPALHGAMRHAIGPRRELGVRTLFNLLGPLTNPAGAQAQVMGVYDPAWTEPLARVLGRLGARRALVVHGAGGMDELSTLGPSQVSEFQAESGEVSTYRLDPAELGLAPATVQDLRGGDAAENAAILRAVLDGEPGPRREIVCLNAAAALLAGGAAAGWSEALAAARRSIDEGEAHRRLDQLVRFSREAAGAGDGAR